MDGWMDFLSFESADGFVKLEWFSFFSTRVHHHKSNEDVSSTYWEKYVQCENKNDNMERKHFAC